MNGRSVGQNSGAPSYCKRLFHVLLISRPDKRLSMHVRRRLWPSHHWCGLASSARFLRRQGRRDQVMPIRLARLIGSGSVTAQNWPLSSVPRMSSSVPRCGPRRDPRNDPRTLGAFYFLIVIAPESSLSRHLAASACGCGLRPPVRPPLIQVVFRSSHGRATADRRRAVCDFALAIMTRNGVPPVAIVT